MADRRMFSKSIVQSAKFLKMPATARLLYYDLGMAADDDGVVEGFTVMRQTGANDDDLRLLITKGFVRLLNEDLVVVITAWKINNFIRLDRYKPSLYKPLLEALPGTPSDNQVTTICQPNDNQTETQVRIGKNNIDKNSIGEVNSEATTPDDFFDIKNPVEDAINCNRIPMSGRAWVELQSLMEDGIDPDMLKLAISDMLDHGVRNWAYLKKILNSWVMKGYKSAADVVRQQDKGKDNGNSESWYQVGFTQ